MGIGESLSHKVGPLPLWGWLGLGAGGVVLFVVFAGRGSRTAGAGQLGYANPTTDQLSGSQLGALQGAIADLEQQQSDQLTAGQQQLTDFITAQSDLVNSMISANNDQMAALIGANSDAQAAYGAQLSGFIGAMQDLMHSYAPGGTAPPATGTNGAATGDVWAGVAAWVKQRVEGSSYWGGHKYVLKSDTNLGDQYSAAVDAYFRTDTANGLNTSGDSAAAQAQLAQLIASGQAALNPLYHG
jgi:hypothetical protein